MGTFTMNTQSKYLRFILTLLTAIIGGRIFSALHIPVPWLLGPMAAILIGSKLTRIAFFWPVKIRDTGLLIFGYSIGLSFTKDALMKMVFQLPIMFLFTFITLLICALLAYIVSKLSRLDYPTVLTGSIPGGLTQMVYFAEETKGIDVSIVTFLQVIRLLVIIFVIPLLVFSPVFGGSHSNTAGAIQEHDWEFFSKAFPEVILYIAIALLFAFLGKKLNSPTPFLLGPIIGTIILNLSGLHGSELPSVIIDLSQLMISVHIGLIMKPDRLAENKNLLWLSLLSGIILVSSSLMLSIILQHFYSVSPATSFLSLAPGGMDQMGIIAHEVKANLSFVAGFQMFRLLFIYFAVPPLLRSLFTKRLDRRTG
ncbi:AbrB family transcriptional regulator [Neobacillus sp. LXY-4]|uniref:AbrB family transcriptional regulator n=1 Tax=Neobacillus sp. LXY-4 TaxID=3379826 RepID=UPI003EE06BE6